MPNFEKYIGKVAAFVREQTEQHVNVRQLDTARAADGIRIGPGAGTELVLKRDTYLELGSPSTASCTVALYSNIAAQVPRTRMTLIGPDIGETGPGCIPFGQVLIASGSGLTEDDYETLVEAQYVTDSVEGYMVRSSSSHIWSRVSNDAVERGFNFATLGRAIEAHAKELVPRVEAVELVFVTCGEEAVRQLAAIAEEVERTAREIRQRVWKQRGVDIFECTSGTHCGKCSDKEICDRIRGMAGQRNSGPENLPNGQAE